MEFGIRSSSQVDLKILLLLYLFYSVLCHRERKIPSQGKQICKEEKKKLNERREGKNSNKNKTESCRIRHRVNIKFCGDRIHCLILHPDTILAYQESQQPQIRRQAHAVC